MSEPYLHESKHFLPSEGHGIDAVKERGEGFSQLKLGLVLVRSLLPIFDLLQGRPQQTTRVLLLLRLAQPLCRRVGEVQRRVHVDRGEWRRRRRRRHLLLVLLRHFVAVVVDLQNYVGKPEEEEPWNQKRLD